jgi:hypothetical protein
MRQPHPGGTKTTDVGCGANGVSPTQGRLREVKTVLVLVAVGRTVKLDDEKSDEREPNRTESEKEGHRTRDFWGYVNYST